jgi:hypothetical protein
VEHWQGLPRDSEAEEPARAAVPRRREYRISRCLPPAKYAATLDNASRPSQAECSQVTQVHRLHSGCRASEPASESTLGTLQLRLGPHHHGSGCRLGAGAAHHL